MIKSLLSDDSNLKKRPLFFYGAGVWCRRLMDACETIGITPDYIVDRNPKLWGKPIKGINTISPAEMQNFDPDCPVIISTYFIRSAEQSLKEYGFHNMWHFPNVGDIIRCFGLNSDEIEEIIANNKEIISTVARHLTDQRSAEVFSGNILRRRANWDNFDDIADPDEYFCADIIRLDRDEILLDGGGYDGRTTLDFIERTNGHFKHIYSFEPLPEMVSVIKDNLKNCSVKEKITVVNMGLDEKPGTVRFVLLGMGSHIDSGGEIKIRADSIDNYFKDKEPPTYITLDIEGTEIQAIVGADTIINKHRPKLAISIYHKFNDLWEIPYYLMHKYPFYNYYIRHHYCGVLQTVCYAIPKDHNEKHRAD